MKTSVLQEIQLVYKSDAELKDQSKINSSYLTDQYLREIWQPDTIELNESFYSIFLDNSNRPLGWLKLSMGGITSTIADSRLLFATALKSRAVSIIIAHNHPSGNLTPSVADRALTKKVAEGAKLLDLTLLDHIILTYNRYYSFADEGLL